MSSRTAEQVAADDALTAAIEQAIAAYAGDGESWVLSEYVVVYSRHRWDDDGDTITGVGGLYRDGDVPLHRVLGLLEYAATRARARIAED